MYVNCIACGCLLHRGKVIASVYGAAAKRYLISPRIMCLRCWKRTDCSCCEYLVLERVEAINQPQ